MFLLKITCFTKQLNEVFMVAFTQKSNRELDNRELLEENGHIFRRQDFIMTKYVCSSESDYLYGANNAVLRGGVFWQIKLGLIIFVCE